MEDQEKILSSHFNNGKSQKDRLGFRVNESRTGIVASLAIHAAFIFLFVIQPAAEMIPVKTFYISFDQGASSFWQNNSGSSPARGTEKGGKAAFIHNHIEKHNPPAQPNAAKHRAMPEQAAAVHHAAIKEATADQRMMHPISEKKDSTNIAETTLPPVIEDAKGDESITAANSNLKSDMGSARDASQSSSSFSRGIAAPGAGGNGSQSGFGDALEGGLGNGSGSGFGNSSGGHASVGAGGGKPLETKFGEMNAPSFIHREMPVYPPLARRRGKEGRVVLTLLIDQAGRIQKIDVTERASYGLTEAAIEAVKKSTFAPARVNGRKVVSRAVLPIRFKLE